LGVEDADQAGADEGEEVLDDLAVVMSFGTEIEGEFELDLAYLQVHDVDFDAGLELLELPVDVAVLQDGVVLGVEQGLEFELLKGGVQGLDVALLQVEREGLDLDVDVFDVDDFGGVVHGLGLEGQEVDAVSLEVLADGGEAHGEEAEVVIVVVDLEEVEGQLVLLVAALAGQEGELEVLHGDHVELLVLLVRLLLDDERNEDPADGELDLAEHELALVPDALLHDEDALGLALDHFLDLHLVELLVGAPDGDFLFLQDVLDGEGELLAHLRLELVLEHEAHLQLDVDVLLREGFVLARLQLENQRHDFVAFF